MWCRTSDPEPSYHIGDLVFRVEVSMQGSFWVIKYQVVSIRYASRRGYEYLVHRLTYGGRDDEIIPEEKLEATEAAAIKVGFRELRDLEAIE